MYILFGVAMLSCVVLSDVVIYKRKIKQQKKQMIKDRECIYCAHWKLTSHCQYHQHCIHNKKKCFIPEV